MRLYDEASRRLYLNASERDRFRRAAGALGEAERVFCLILLHTGCRISEALSLTSVALQPEARVITFRTLKRRRRLMREVPVPVELVEALCALIGGQPERAFNSRIWPVSRITAYRWVKAAMAEANIKGEHASPKGLRHGYGVYALGCGIPLNMLSKWMGHASIKTTAIYANALGPEELAIAARMWP